MKIEFKNKLLQVLKYLFTFHTVYKQYINVFREIIIIFSQSTSYFLILWKEICEFNPKSISENLISTSGFIHTKTFSISIESKLQITNV